MATFELKNNFKVPLEFMDASDASYSLPPPWLIPAGGAVKWSAGVGGFVTYRTAPQRTARDALQFTVQWSISADDGLAVKTRGEGNYTSTMDYHSKEGWAKIEVGRLRRGPFGW